MRCSRGRGHPLVRAVAIVAVVALGVATAACSGDDDTETVATEGEDDSGALAEDRDQPVDDENDAAEDDAAEGDDAGVTSGTGTADPAPSERVELASGSFVSLDYEVSGQVRLLERPDGRHVVRLVDLVSEDAPALVVYLSTNPAGGPGDAFTDDFVDLGPLLSTTGTQEYEVRADVDPTRFASVLIWCVEFGVPFGAADL